jgi:4-hydroxy-tetrahydrodipicolinate synthase
MYKGAITAIATPFNDNEIDYDSYRKLIEFQLQEGIDGLVTCGSTGEAATMSTHEQIQTIACCVDAVAGRVPVIAGTGSNDTKKTIDMTKSAKEIGANAALVVAPFYNKPTQEGLYQHFKHIAESVDIPIILYNVPGRTASNIESQTVLRLLEIPNIIGMKEASGNLNQISRIIEGTKDKENFTVLSGDDELTFVMLCLGAKGVISVASNVYPSAMVKLVTHFFNNELEQARTRHYSLLNLYDALFWRSNPIPVKQILFWMELFRTPDLRLPLVTINEADEVYDKLKRVAVDNGLINGNN